jgi:hypothetical protein
MTLSAERISPDIGNDKLPHGNCGTPGEDRYWVRKEFGKSWSCGQQKAREGVCYDWFKPIIRSSEKVGRVGSRRPGRVSVMIGLNQS